MMVIYACVSLLFSMVAYFPNGVSSVYTVCQQATKINQIRGFAFKVYPDKSVLG